MRPAFFYVSDAFLQGGPSAREAEALRQAGLAQVRSLLAEIAAEQPCTERASAPAFTRDAAPTCCPRELMFA